MYSLSKFLPLLVMPLTLGIALQMIGILFFVCRNHARGILFTCAGFVILFVFSLPVVSHTLLSGLEKHSEYAEVSDESGILIILAGALDRPKPGAADAELGVRADRLRVAHELLSVHEFRAVVITGNHKPSDDQIQAQGEIGGEPVFNQPLITKNLLLSWGIKNNRFILEPDSFNTYQSVLKVKEILAQENTRNAYVLTSAYRMPRAMMLFKRLAPEFEYRSILSDRLTGELKLSLSSFVPSATSLSGSTLAIREMLGSFVYSTYISFSDKH